MPVSFDERVVHTVRQLLAARRIRRPLSMLDERYAPSSIAEAYAIQEAMTRELGAEVAGWKVGLIPGVQVTHAPIYREACLASPAHVSLSAHDIAVIEGEVAFVLARPLPVRTQPHALEDVKDAVGTVCAAIEIGAPRLRNFMTAPLAHKIADNVGNGAVILGTGTRTFGQLDLGTLRVRLVVGDETVTDLVGGNSAGDPWAALLALANSPHRQQPLRVGQIVISGTCTGIYDARPDIVARVVFEALGEAHVALGLAPTEGKSP